MSVQAVAGALVAAIAVFALFVLLCYTAYVFIQHKRYSHIPSPKGAWFLFGHVPILSSKMKRPDYFFSKVLLDWHREVGPVYVFWALHIPRISTTVPDHIKELADPHVGRPDEPSMRKGWGERVLGTSILLMQNYDEWKDRRKAFNPAFSRSYLKELVPVFNKCVKSVIEERMRNSADGKTVVDLKEVFYQVTHHIISQIGFGMDFSKDPFTQKVAGSGGLQPVLNDLFVGILELFANPYAKYLFPWRKRKYAKTADIIRAVGRNCIEQRIRALENKQDVPQDILTYILGLLRTDENIGIEDMVDEFLTFYIAGQDTTASLLSFTLILVLKHPDILHRLLEEIDEVVGDKETVSADDLENLKYMRQVLREVLRLYPPGTFTFKSSPPGFTILEKPIPENSYVMINIYTIHNSDEYYTDPETFDPDRFDSGQERPSPYSYIPFGVGPRMCIGKVLALMEAKVVLCHLLQSFDLFLPDNYQLKLNELASLTPADGIPCTFIPR